MANGKWLVVLTRHELRATCQLSSGLLH